jgi:thiamine biosynthesis lipoprotein
MQTGKAVGTTVELRLVADSQEKAESCFTLLWDDIELFEKRFSRFLPDSELSEFNTHAGDQVQVSDEFRALLRTAKEYGELTNGVYNPFILPALQRAGYTHSLSNPSSPAPLYVERTHASYDRMEVGEDWARIPKECAIDSGGIGKGYLADELGKRLLPLVNDYCLSLGGDMLVRGTDIQQPWEVTVQAVNRDGDSATFSLEREAYGIATSGLFRVVDGVTQHHLIDPRTGEPAKSEFSLCTVVATSATTADVLASCILIEGIPAAERYLAKGHVLAVLLQAEAGNVVTLGAGFTRM